MNDFFMFGLIVISKNKKTQVYIILFLWENFNSNYYVLDQHVFCQGKEKMGRRELIAPIRNCTHLLKNVLNLFVCRTFTFFLTIFLSLSDLFPWWL